MTQDDDEEVRVNARLDPKHARILKELAEHRDGNVSQVLREAIAAYGLQFEQREARAEKALQAFIASVEGPRTLSTDYKETLGKSLIDKI